MIAVLSDAVKLLLDSYDKYEDIEDIRKKREFVDKQLEIFTGEILKLKEKQLENEKPVNNTPAEIIRHNKLSTEYNIFKIQREAYLEMQKNIDKYDDIEKDMNKKIKAAKAFEKDVVKINSCFENVKIEW